MKIAIGAAAILAVVALAAQSYEPPKASEQGMTLRLELFVNDLEKSAAFYVDVLGFERLPGAPEYVPVRSGSVLIGLGRANALPERHYFNPEVQSGRRGLGTEIVLEVDDVEASCKKVQEKRLRDADAAREAAVGSHGFSTRRPGRLLLADHVPLIDQRSGHGQKLRAVLDVHESPQLDQGHRHIEWSGFRSAGLPIVRFPRGFDGGFDPGRLHLAERGHAAGGARSKALPSGR